MPVRKANPSKRTASTTHVVETAQQAARDRVLKELGEGTAIPERAVQLWLHKLRATTRRANVG